MGEPIGWVVMGHRKDGYRFIASTVVNSNPGAARDNAAIYARRYPENRYTVEPVGGSAEVGRLDEVLTLLAVKVRDRCAVAEGFGSYPHSDWYAPIQDLVDEAVRALAAPSEGDTETDHG